jgi:hypothetical protein
MSVLNQSGGAPCSRTLPLPTRVKDEREDRNNERCADAVVEHRLDLHFQASGDGSKLTAFFFECVAVIGADAESGISPPRRDQRRGPGEHPRVDRGMPQTSRCSSGRCAFGGWHVASPSDAGVCRDGVCSVRYSRATFVAI